MNKLTLLFGVLLCAVVVSARHYREQSETEGLTDETEDEFRKPKEREAGPLRHRKRRWQPQSLWYDNQPPYPYYQDRRDYDRNTRDYDRNNEVLQQILKLLDEISTHVKRAPLPPPPPQPIYIPYPVPYPVPQYIACKPAKTNITFPTRWPVMEDIYQNWGFIVPKEEDNGSDGARPISFESIKPNQPMPRPSPSVEHGSSQARLPATESPTFGQSSSSAPGMCNAAILSCCGMADKLQQIQCFANIGCNSYESGKSCSSESVASALNSFKVAYSPAP